MMKPLSGLKEAPQVRHTYDEAELLLLGQSLKKRQLQAILIRPDGTIIAGHRRYRAAKLVGLETLEAKVIEGDLSPSDIRGMQLTENIHRADLTGFEMWSACKELLELNPGWQGKDLAEHLNRDPSQVTRLLSVSKCSPEWQQALKAGKVTISDCYEASKRDLSDMGGLLAFKLSGASREDLSREGRRARNAAKNGDTDTVKLEKLPVALNAGVVIIKAKKDQEALNLAAARLLLIAALAKVDAAIKLGYSARTATLAWAETKDKVREPRKPRKAKDPA